MLSLLVVYFVVQTAQAYIGLAYEVCDDVSQEVLNAERLTSANQVFQISDFQLVKSPSRWLIPTTTKCNSSVLVTSKALPAGVQLVIDFNSLEVSTCDKDGCDNYTPWLTNIIRVYVQCSVTRGPKALLVVGQQASEAASSRRAYLVSAVCGYTVACLLNIVAVSILLKEYAKAMHKTTSEVQMKHDFYKKNTQHRKTARAPEAVPAR